MHRGVLSMELRQIETFCSVVRTGGFSRAAEELFMTQPAVSLQMRALEHELGVTLFERRGRAVHLTHAGEMLHDYALRIVQTAREARQAMSEAASGEVGRVVVGAGATTTIFTLPPVLQEMHSGHPGVEVIIRSGPSHEVAQMVRSGEVDLGLVTSPVADEDLIARPLLTDNVLAIVGPGHPLASRRSATLPEFAREPLILYVKGSGFRAFLDGVFSGAGLTPQVQMELDSIEAIKALVEIGLGASMVPEVAVKSEVAAGRLVPLALEDLPRLSRTLEVIYRKDKHLSPAIRVFLDMLVGKLGAREPDPR
jgi:LysR family transcriptional regulator, low CO2-responsive transcriptional regulator